MDFSLEYAAERIYDAKTKGYFSEVLKSYYNESYRSAVVMLYTIAVCDLVYKLQELRELYQDETASEILNEVSKMQRDNPRSPEWEIKLIEMVKSRTFIIDGTEFTNIENLRNHRHLSAHPVMDEDYVLYMPNRETVRAHIRNMLEGILTKPPILSKKITDAFIVDLARVRNTLPDEAALTRYLEAKYFRNLTIEVETRIFSSLWKLTFRLVDSDCNEYRNVNYRALRIAFLRRKDHFAQVIIRERQWYSNVEIGEPMRYLIGFLSEFPHVFNLLDEGAQALIQGETKKDPDQFAKAVFMSGGDMTTHVLKLLTGDLELMDPVNTMRYLYERGAEAGCENPVLFIMIKLFADSDSYDNADYHYQHFIQPYLDKFNGEHLLEIIRTIEQNSQLSGRGRARFDNYEIMTKCDAVLGTDFDYAEYPLFYRPIKERKRS